MMKLSDALRLGATLAPQVKGVRHTREGGACALGHAELAVSQNYRWTADGDIDHLDLEYRRAEAFWPILSEQVSHPVNGAILELRSIIADLNNYYDWTTNQIADWVATIEPTTVDEVSQRANAEKFQPVESQKGSAKP